MSEKIKKYTYFLFARPSFFSGIGRIFDFNNSYNVYNKSKTPAEADFKALYLDWVSVGQDLNLAMKNYERNN